MENGPARLYRCEIAISGANVSMVSTYIGSSVHADIHTLVFAPGDQINSGPAVMVVSFFTTL